MSKHKLTLSINEDVVKRARYHGINLSAFLEIKLQEHLALIHDKRYNKSDDMDLSGFEPEASSMPRRRSSELIYKPKNKRHII